MDLATEWRSRRWRKLLNLIEGLPRTSAFIEAMSDDDDVAAVMLSQPREDRQTGPRLSEYSPEREALDRVLDRLGEVIQAVVASAGGSAPKIKPAPRPHTAVDRARARQAWTRHNSLVARLTPKDTA